MKFEKKKLKILLKQENNYIFDLLTNFNVPDTIEDMNYEDYLLNSKGREFKSLSVVNRVTEDEFEDRINKIKNKIKTRKYKTSEKSLKRREAKKLRKNKQLKKVIECAHKIANNESFKSERGSIVYNMKNDRKKLIPKPIFNAEGKIVFSKFDFAAHPGAKVNKSKKENIMKNPHQILQQIKEADKKLQKLEEQGEEAKIKELKAEKAWQKAFDKIDGKKVKDDPKLLYKAIKRKKDMKMKSKQQWIERRNKVEQDKQNKQKKRAENINKKLSNRKNKKLKRMSKKGRVIPGF